MCPALDSEDESLKTNVTKRKSGLRRWAALAVTATVISIFLSPLAEAGKATQNFTVSTNITNIGMFVANNLNFGVYTSGQAAALNASTTFTVDMGGVIDVCSLNFTTASGIFQMTGGTSALNYRLCNDSACTQPYAQGVNGPTFFLTFFNQPYTYTLYGQILGNQTGTFGNSVHQTVTATLNY